MHVAKRFRRLAAATAVFLLAAAGPAEDSPKGGSTAPGGSIPAPRVPGALDPNLWPSGLTGGEPFELLIRGAEEAVPQGAAERPRAAAGRGPGRVEGGPLLEARLRPAGLAGRTGDRRDRGVRSTG